MLFYFVCRLGMLVLLILWLLVCWLFVSVKLLSWWKGTSVWSHNNFVIFNFGRGVKSNWMTQYFTFCVAYGCIYLAYEVEYNTPNFCYPFVTVSFIHIYTQLICCRTLFMKKQLLCVKDSLHSRLLIGGKSWVKFFLRSKIDCLKALNTYKRSKKTMHRCSRYRHNNKNSWKTSMRHG